MISGKERFIVILVLLITASLFNLIPFFKIGSDSTVLFYAIYALTPYFVYGFLINNVGSRTIIYTTSAFMLILDYFIKFDIYKNLDEHVPGMMFEGFFIAPFILVAFATVSFILGIVFTNLYKRFVGQDIDDDVIFTRFIRFKDKELAKFVLIVVILGMLINMQNFSLSSSSTLVVLYTIFTGMNLSFSSEVMNILAVLFAIFPYCVFVYLSYKLNSKWLSYLLGFMILIFDIYLKVITGIVMIPDMAYEDNVVNTTFSVFMPFIFFMFVVVPIAFAVIAFGKKFLHRKI